LPRANQEDAFSGPTNNQHGVLMETLNTYNTVGCVPQLPYVFKIFLFCSRSWPSHATQWPHRGLGCASAFFSSIYPLCRLWMRLFQSAIIRMEMSLLATSLAFQRTRNHHAEAVASISVRQITCVLRLMGRTMSLVAAQTRHVIRLPAQTIVSSVSIPSI
jgi:hypothetical protein